VTQPTQSNDETIFALVGGAETFQRLVDRFYGRVEADVLLRPMFPDDLAPGKQAQLLFLMQFFGGGNAYSVERGHPRLRMRHFPFAIDREARARWLGHMLAAIDEVGIEEPMRGVMVEYFERGSLHMINRDDPSDLSADLIQPSTHPTTNEAP